MLLHLFHRYDYEVRPKIYKVQQLQSALGNHGPLKVVYRSR